MRSPRTGAFRESQIEYHASWSQAVNAEQITRQLELGITAIVAHVQDVAAWAIDGDNDTSLSTPRWEDKTLSGVR